jgi:hypothetical protein
MVASMCCFSCVYTAALRGRNVLRARRSSGNALQKAPEALAPAERQQRRHLRGRARHNARHPRVQTLQEQVVREGEGRTF